MRSEQLRGTLLLHQDETYRQMQVKLIPNIPPETIIGVRTPVLRNLAKELEDREVFLKSLPHNCFEENQIHSFLLERGKDFHAVMREVEAFLPYVDNWATCDQLRPKCFAKHRQDLLPYLHSWISSDHFYTVRFGIGMLMVHFLDEDFSPEYLEIVASVRREDYYVRMMAAWYFATALAKQYDAALPYISGRKLDRWVHNKAIQKAVESYRVSTDHKKVLVQYRLK